MALLESYHLNTPRAVIDPRRNTAIWRWDLHTDAFGSHPANQDPDGDGTNYTLNLRYPGQYFDTDTNLHYNYFRDYEPLTGRYLQSDPIGLDGGLNTYAYVDGNPNSVSDPFGLEGTGPWTRPPQLTPTQLICGNEKSCANSAFWRNYNDMRKANWIGADKYFHCKANCEATRCGKCGKDQACDISDSREWFDQNIKRDPAWASADDQYANDVGRDGADVFQALSCPMVCSRFRPAGLPSQY